MTTTALQRSSNGALVSADGEIAYEPAAYLASLSEAGIQQQQQLAAAYDAACKALIGPNDIQKDGGREFKKKSAWRKLARHFNISVESDRGDVTMQRFDDGSWMATARATATAPWGQSFTDVGGCGSDEATGRRTITMADAIATAMTRAVNRAVSNLIAMGEVSAEEIGDRGAYDARPRSTTTRSTTPRRTSAPSTGSPTMPFGKTKGTPLANMDENDLQGALDWAVGKGKFEEFQRDAEAELARRRGGNGNPPSFDEVPAGLQDDEDPEIPF